MDFDTIQTYLNQLRANILTFIQSQKNNATFKETTKNGEHTTIEGAYKFSLARISTLWLLTDRKRSENKLSISEICQLQNNFIEKISEGKRVYWSCTDKGIALAKKFQEATLWKET